MKAANNIIAAIIRPLPFLLLFALSACSTYNSQLGIENDLYNGDFDKVASTIENNRFLKKDKNRLLYLLEKGKAEHLRGNYEASNRLLEEAYLLVDDKIKTSAAQYVAAKFTNPNAEPYKGEDFEKVTIHYYKAINFFMMGRPDDALVEAKRINLRLLEFNDKYEGRKNKYTRDAFSQILQGIIYESTGDINNAFIAYRNAEEIYSSSNNVYFGVKFPEQLKQDLLRTAMQLGFRQEYDDYLKKFNFAKDYVPAPPAPAEAILFWENGLGPAKDQIILTVSASLGAFVATYTEDGITREIIIPIPRDVDLGVINAIAIPKYNRRESFYKHAIVTCNSNEQNLETVEDFYPIAEQCLNDRMMREVVDLALRFATKKAAGAGLGTIAKENLGGDWGDIVRAASDIAGAATEKADTRNWQTLPATISYARFPLKQGENKATLKKFGPDGVVDTDILTIPFRPGLQIVNYYDLGRTQVTPPQATAVQPAREASVIPNPANH
ncbi:hypothetical protein CHU92_14290 [Flavobacterium cyanobacteriorum]|uniref:Tetratricopeptide repeat protein n=1 Tax=Flavobacterium cyanobacteriorum TaxID=2022802 RepID=A0A255YSU8_9FLAO|nr:hypothetical protein [Flavobacterium cyanobacteriorum]OYQ32251.1 hypothetical protein CHU92_14290 [Flavobacterium cyanobacteriorum]